MIPLSFNVNTIPVMRIIKRFYHKLESQQNFYCGVMVSIAGFMSSPFFSIYAATKAALIGFTNTLAKEAGRKNITVNCISPGMIKTDILKTIPKDILEAKINSTAAKRLGEPSELAAAVAFLACDDSSWVTGHTMMVCGGQKMHA